ncbi:thiopeptide-type bacteriocin biosynthesis protein [Streptosporangium sp. NBC_01495]|nr:thiopeptide-type bacteriocin biosynthesis protein [Streptosporangium sp. NBC_01495]
MADWGGGLYEPETEAFGGPESMAIAHEVFCADSPAALAQTGSPLAKERGILLLSTMNRAAGLDPFEIGDVWAKLANHRPPIDPSDAARRAAAVTAMRRLMNADAAQRETTEPGWADRVAAFEDAGRRLARFATGGHLRRGLRAVLAHHAIFAFNRAAVPVAEQAATAWLGRHVAFGDDEPATVFTSRSAPVIPTFEKMETTITATVDPTELREAMVAGFTDSGHLRTPAIIEAFREIERHRFIPEADVEAAYADDAVSVKHDETDEMISCISAPSIVATQLEQLGAQPGHKVLEAGAATGYNAALLGRLVAPTGHVWTVDVDEDLVNSAQKNLAAASLPASHEPAEISTVSGRTATSSKALRWVGHSERRGRRRGRGRRSLLHVTAETTETRRHDVSDDLPLLSEAFRLGRITDLRYLSDGLMNRNWRVRAERGTYALKEILDVALPIARRNLRVLVILTAEGMPVCSPEVSVDGDVVVEIGGRGYCLLPWVDGVHLRGTELSLDQSADLGVLLGQIHQRLNHLPPEAGLPEATAALRAKVTDPATAIAEANRFLAVISSLDAPQPFDVAAAELLEQRTVLIDKYGAQRPTGEVPAGPVGWTHGDVQHRNILWRDGAVIAVLDWDRIRARPFAEEVARTATVQFGGESGHLDLERVAAFVGGYRSLVPLRREDLADAVERLWWKRMSDFWQLDYHYDRGDHGPDELFLSAERFLLWWTERREEVQAAFATA